MNTNVLVHVQGKLIMFKVKKCNNSFFTNAFESKFLVTFVYLRFETISKESFSIFVI